MMDLIKTSSFSSKFASLDKQDAWHQGAAFEFMGHRYVAYVSGRYYSLFEPWVFDASISSLDGSGPLKGSSRHSKSEKKAIQHAFNDFICDAIKNKLITKEQAKQLTVTQLISKFFQ